MKIIKTCIFVMLALTVFFSACDGGSTSQKAGKSSITEGVMTTGVDDDSKPTKPAETSFDVDTSIIYCSFKVQGAVSEDMVKASWYYVQGEAVGRENELLNETFTIPESDTDSYYLAFYLDKPVSGWLKGDYKVVLSVNNVEKLAVPFTIK